MSAATSTETPVEVGRRPITLGLQPQEVDEPSSSAWIDTCRTAPHVHWATALFPRASTPISDQAPNRLPTSGCGVDSVEGPAADGLAWPRLIVLFRDRSRRPS